MSVNDPMMESKHHDPMLDGITRYGDPTHDYMLPAHGEGFVVLFSDLPALLAAAREDERGKTIVSYDLMKQRKSYEQGQRDEREAAAQRVIKQGVSIVAGRPPQEYIMLSLAVAAVRGEQT